MGYRGRRVSAWPQQEPRKKRPKAKKDDKPFSGDLLENPGSAGEMHFSYEERKKCPRDAAQLVVDIATGEVEDREPISSDSAISTKLDGVTSSGPYLRC